MTLVPFLSETIACSRPPLSYVARASSWIRAVTFSPFEIVRIVVAGKSSPPRPDATLTGEGGGSLGAVVALGLPYLAIAMLVGDVADCAEMITKCIQRIRPGANNLIRQELVDDVGPEIFSDLAGGGVGLRDPIPLIVIRVGESRLSRNAVVGGDRVAGDIATTVRVVAVRFIGLASHRVICRL